MSETDIAPIRFGYGHSPDAPARRREDLLEEAFGPDRARRDFPGLSAADGVEITAALRTASRNLRDENTEANRAALMAAQNAIRASTVQAIQVSAARILDNRAPLRERLMWFWADHFTARATTRNVRPLLMSYLDDAIRPHILGPFADMLKAVIRHPLMLTYLDQHQSIGPNSSIGQRTGRGLNENLARELLELHTLGVGGGYTQADVTQTAELLTGLSAHPTRGFSFRRPAAEPGAEEILGQSYGGNRRADLSDIDAFLDDLAARPETARHLGRKLAVHFHSDTPPEALVEALTRAYMDSDGDLGAVTQTLLTHPATANPTLGKTKPPLGFLVSGLLALGVTGENMMAWEPPRVRRMLMGPMIRMGQAFMQAPGPDGWPEEAAHWITPPSLANRISWATTIAHQRARRTADPRAFLANTLRSVAGERLQFAVSAAETRAEGLALVLASAEFNRR